MSSEDRDALIAQFQSITGLDDADRATFFLEASNWNVDLAISSFFDDPDGAVNVPPEAINPNVPSSEQLSSTKSSQETQSTTGGKLDKLQLKWYTSPASYKFFLKFPGKLLERKITIIFETFCYSGSDDPMVESDDSDKEDDYGQAFYAGGGQQVMYSHYDLSIILKLP